jgi:Spy/CpxP family protein refolding chaperone
VKGGFDMNMKRKIWSSIAVVALAATPAIPVIAQPPQAPQTSQGRVGPGRGGPGGPLPLLRGLNLTDAQREQVRALTAERRNQADNPSRKVAELEGQLRLAIFADAPDQQKISELKAAIDAASAEELTARIDLQTRVAQILTDEQRAQAREALSNNAGRRGPAFGRRGGRARSGA